MFAEQIKPLAIWSSCCWGRSHFPGRDTDTTLKPFGRCCLLPLRESLVNLAWCSLSPTCRRWPSNPVRSHHWINAWFNCFQNKPCSYWIQQNSILSSFIRNLLSAEQIQWKHNRYKEGLFSPIWSLFFFFSLLNLKLQSVSQPGSLECVDRDESWLRLDSSLMMPYSTGLALTANLICWLVPQGDGSRHVFIFH